jgi:hypothetical protein
MPVTPSATTRKHMNYNTTRSSRSQTLRAAGHDVGSRKHCYNTPNAHVHSYTNTHTQNV